MKYILFAYVYLLLQPVMSLLLWLTTLVFGIHNDLSNLSLRYSKYCRLQIVHYHNRYSKPRPS